MMECMTNRQIANHARMSLEKFVRSGGDGDFQHLKDAHEILSEAIQREYDKDKQLTEKAGNYS